MSKPPVDRDCGKIPSAKSEIQHKSTGLIIKCLGGLLFSGKFDGIGSHLSYSFGHLLGDLDESGGLTRGEVMHLHPFSPDPYALQNLLCLFHPFARPDITAVVSAFSFPTTQHIDAISPFLKGPEEMNEIYLAGTWNADDIYIVRVLKTNGTCQVRGRIPSCLTTECNNDWFKIFHYRTPSSKASTLPMT